MDVCSGSDQCLEEYGAVSLLSALEWHLPSFLFTSSLCSCHLFRFVTGQLKDAGRVSSVLLLWDIKIQLHGSQIVYLCSSFFMHCSICFLIALVLTICHLASFAVLQALIVVLCLKDGWCPLFRYLNEPLSGIFSLNSEIYIFHSLDGPPE